MSQLSQVFVALERYNSCCDGIANQRTWSPLANVQIPRRACPCPSLIVCACFFTSSVSRSTCCACAATHCRPYCTIFSVSPHNIELTICVLHLPLHVSNTFSRPRTLNLISFCFVLSPVCVLYVLHASRASFPILTLSNISVRAFLLHLCPLTPPTSYLLPSSFFLLPCLLRSFLFHFFHPYTPLQSLSPALLFPFFHFASCSHLLPFLLLCHLHPSPSSPLFLPSLIVTVLQPRYPPLTSSRPSTLSFIFHTHCPYIKSASRPCPTEHKLPTSLSSSPHPLSTRKQATATLRTPNCSWTSCP